MSLYGDYIKERINHGIVEDDKGFATYQLREDNGYKTCYITDIFVKKEFRKKGLAKEYTKQIEEIAKSNNCQALLGTVVIGTKNPEISLIVQFNIGFKLLMNEGNTIWLIKEIK